MLWKTMLCSDAGHFISRISWSLVQIRFFTGLNITWIPACPKDKQLWNFACPGQVLVCFFLIKLANDLPVPWHMGKWDWKVIGPAGKSTCPWQPYGIFFQPCLPKERCFKIILGNWKLPLKPCDRQVEWLSRIEMWLDFLDKKFILLAGGYEKTMSCMW